MIWEWLDRAEYWLFMPSISPVLLVLILGVWPGLISKLRRAKQDAPDKHRGLYYFGLAAHVAAAGMLLWWLVIEISVA